MVELQNNQTKLDFTSETRREPQTEGEQSAFSLIKTDPRSDDTYLNPPGPDSYLDPDQIGLTHRYQPSEST